MVHHILLYFHAGKQRKKKKKKKIKSACHILTVRLDILYRATEFSESRVNFGKKCNVSLNGEVKLTLIYVYMKKTDVGMTHFFNYLKS